MYYIVIQSARPGNCHIYEIGAGTSEIRRWLIGRELFEESEN